MCVTPQQPLPSGFQQQLEVSSEWHTVAFLRVGALLASFQNGSTACLQGVAHLHGPALACIAALYHLQTTQPKPASMPHHLTPVIPNPGTSHHGPTLIGYH